MTHRIIIFFFFSFLSLNFLAAQESEMEEGEEDIVIIESDFFISPRMVAKWSFSSLANVHPALQFGFEHHLKDPKHAMYYELGTFIPYNGTDNSVYPLYGFRLRKRHIVIVDVCQTRERHALIVFVVFRITYAEDRCNNTNLWVAIVASLIPLRTAKAETET